jgi:hypothetical protein
MEQPADRDIFTKFVEAIDGGLGLQDFHLDAVLGQKLQGIGTDLQSPPDPFREHNGPCAVFDQLLNVGGLNARYMACARLTPVPLPCAAGKDLGILKRRMAFNLYVAPGKMRDTWGIRFSLAHVFNRKEFSAFRLRNGMLPTP